MNVATATRPTNGPAHIWFGLTYSNYLVLHRTLVQSMPTEWQQRMVACLSELQDAFAHIPQAETYEVHAAIEQEGGEDELLLVRVADPIPHYNRGRAYVEPRLAAPATTTDPLIARWDRTVIHPQTPDKDTIVCCLAEDGQPVALILDDELREALGLQLVDPNPEGDR